VGRNGPDLVEALTAAYRIRPATPADADAISEAMFQAGLDAWGPYLGTERMQLWTQDRQYTADLVAEDDRGVFALVAWDEHTGEVERLYTHPRGQGRGAGTELLRRAEEALRAAGCTEAWLNTEERNTGARRFYERNGWAEKGSPRVRDWHGAHLVEPRYAKRL
jgi:ribosomal protein S18 acetylase RimI-like enzyme